MKLKLYPGILIAMLFAAICCNTASGQKVLVTVRGNQLVSTISGAQGGGQYITDGKCLYYEIDPLDFYIAGAGVSARLIVCPASEIVGMTVCIINNEVIVTMLLKNGGIQEYNGTTHSLGTGPLIPNANGNQPPQQICGDALYARSYNYVSKSTDHGQTWVLDTLGLQGTFLHSICTDTFQKAYLGSNLGLLTQQGNSNAWLLNAHFPESYCDLVYVDRRNRLFAEGTATLYMSTDTGASFQADNTGLPSLGLQKITAMGDDAYGNIYAIIGGNKIYRSTGGSQPFVRIDQSLSALNNDSLYTYLQPFVQVNGDSVLFAATAYGFFYSVDQGNSWVANNNGISTEHFFGLAQANNGNLITTTDLGCFASTNTADTAWQKVYPDTGYVVGRPLYKDNAGNLYTQGGTLFGDNNFQTRFTVKSTDNGANWIADTLGISQITTATWFVDETGAQHAAEWVNYGSSPTKIFSKVPGQSWVPDNAGFVGDSTIPNAFGSNGNGKIYYSGNILRSKQGAGTWLHDSAGLNNALGVFDFAHKSNGMMYLGAYAGVWKETGTGWTELAPPPGIYNINSAFAIAVDASNTLWAAYSHFDINYQSIGDGVWYTNDDGATWHQPSFQIDTVTFRKLVAIGDSVYGLSYYDGAYLFDKNGSIGIATPPTNNGGLALFPNPTKNRCTLQLSAGFETSTAVVLDITGREILPLYANQRVSTFNFSTGGLSAGLYFVRVVDDKGRLSVCKLVRE